VAALERNKMACLNEKNVQNNIWPGLSGEIVRNILDAQSIVL
jgi:hypothetical protein